MKLNRRELRKLIHESINEAMSHERNFRKAQLAHDNMQQPDFYEGDPSSFYASDEEIFDFAVENLIDLLIDRAVDEGILTDEQVENMSDEELIPILRQNFKSDLYKDEYDQYN
jgi:hypothetical protein